MSDDERRMTEYGIVMTDEELAQRHRTWHAKKLTPRSVPAEAVEGTVGAGEVVGGRRALRRVDCKTVDRARGGDPKRVACSRDAHVAQPLAQARCPRPERAGRQLCQVEEREHSAARAVVDKDDARAERARRSLRPVSSGGHPRDRRPKLRLVQLGRAERSHPRDGLGDVSVARRRDAQLVHEGARLARNDEAAT